MQPGLGKILLWSPWGISGAGELQNPDRAVGRLLSTLEIDVFPSLSSEPGARDRGN